MLYLCVSYTTERARSKGLVSGGQAEGNQRLDEPRSDAIGVTTEERPAEGLGLMAHCNSRMDEPCVLGT